jgi:hypothetical protein
VSLLAEVHAYFASTGQSVEAPADAGWIEVPGFGASGSWRLIAEAREEERVVIVYSVLEQAVPERRRPETAQLLNRLNFDLVAGNFEMDDLSGELRFRTSLAAGAEPAGEGRLKELVGFNLATMDQHLPVLRDLLSE